MSAGWKRQGARIVSLVASGALLAALYRNLDVRQIGHALLSADRLWLAISVGLILPITALRAVRFFWVAPAGALPGIGEALRLTLVASALNVFVPAKGGDLIKSYFVRRRSDTPTGVAIAIVVYERLCDLFGLIFWCLAGWLVGRPQVPGLPSSFWLVLGTIGVVCAVLISSEGAAGVWQIVTERVLPYGRLRRVRELAAGWPDLLRLLGRRRWRIVIFSPVLWLAHLFQIWLFTVALSAQVPFTVCASLAAVALMAGQIPFTFAGLGTRDVALVVLLSRYMGPESAAALGILTATRNLLPPLIGLPMMWPYLASVAEDMQRPRTDVEAG
jgi:hypothetical protein